MGDMANRLGSETSPYLLQHKENPVDWNPWGEEALAEARRRDVPILLSIGYAACHWCHVMERESFEDEETARLMNRDFVCIKVDREERPDLDAVYMEAVQAMTGQGGWPMTVFLTPRGLPFYGGTYFPPEDRYGMPSFRRLMIAVTETWNERRAEVESQGQRLVEHMGSFAKLRPSADEFDPRLLDDSFDGLKGAFDPVNGGFGGAPKFPQPMTIDLLLRLSRNRRPEATEMALTTLDAMASGGMYDQLGGGFARYSVDAGWVVPHFEKMLYDNAQLLRTYARSWQATRSERHAEIARQTADWMLREMRDPTGGFWSSLDADSEGEEGRYYVWTSEEVREATGDDFEAARAHWGFTPEGNFEGRNIPVYAAEPQDAEVIERARRKLMSRRAERVRPATDTKVLTAWNGLAAAAFAEAGAILEREWIAVAEETMRFVLAELRVDGRLLRSFRDGVAKQPGFAEDYAFTLEGCLALYEATGQVDWLEEARWTADSARELFLDRDAGGFFTTGSDAERLVTASKELVDNAIPATNSVLALEFQRLTLITGEDRYKQDAVDILRLIAQTAARSPQGFGHLLGALDLYLSEPLEIVIVGDPKEADTRSLLDTVNTRYLPNKVIVLSDTPDAAVSPLLEARNKLKGRATAYVCRNRTCKQPVDTPEGLVDQLAL
jgi:uncharacterized protein YyaL (SSP411 family)